MSSSKWHFAWSLPFLAELWEWFVPFLLASLLGFFYPCQNQFCFPPSPSIKANTATKYPLFPSHSIKAGSWSFQSKETNKTNPKKQRQIHQFRGSWQFSTVLEIKPPRSEICTETCIVIVIDLDTAKFTQNSACSQFQGQVTNFILGTLTYTLLLSISALGKGVNTWQEKSWANCFQHFIPFSSISSHLPPTPKSEPHAWCIR